MAHATVAAWIGSAVINVVLAVEPLESRPARASVRAYVVVASGPVLTRVGVAFVDFMLTVGSFIARQAVTLMCVAFIVAFTSVVAHLGHWQVLVSGSNGARDGGNITQSACPFLWTLTLERVARLHALAAVIAGPGSTPVDESLAILSSVTVRAVASVIPDLVQALSIIQARV